MSNAPKDAPALVERLIAHRAFTTGKGGLGVADVVEAMASNRPSADLSGPRR